MRSLRITSRVRDRLAQLIVNAYIADEQASLEAAVKARDELALAILPNPEEACNMHVWAECDGHQPHGFAIHLAEGRRIYSHSTASNNAALYALAAEVAHRSRIKSTKFNAIYAQTQELLRNCTTTRMLLEAWPDAAQFVEKLVIDNVEQAAATKADIRKRLGLQLAKKFEEAGFDTVLDTSENGETQ